MKNRRRRDEPEEAVMSEKIIITISREFGTGGHLIGKRLAEKLGIAFYDNELIQIAAKEMGFNENYIKNNEEKVPEFSFSGLFSGVAAYTSNPSDRIQEQQFEMIRDIAEKESCVIVGRAADYILQDYPGRVSIFLFAPLEARVRRLAQDTVHYKAYLPEESYTEEQLVKAVKAIDKQRRKYYEFYTENQWGERDIYDLLINTERTGIDGAIALIETYIKTGRGKDITSDL